MRRIIVTLRAPDKIAIFPIEVDSDNQLQQKLSGIAKSNRQCVITYREGYRTSTYNDR